MSGLEKAGIALGLAFLVVVAVAAATLLLDRDEERPLAVTRAAYDEASGPTLTPPDLNEATHASLHATGYSFDVRRRYGSGAQAQAFQWTLERMQALGLIAWTRGRAVIHVTASPLADVARD